MTDRAVTPTLPVDPSNNTETDDETIALKKKRARRVSFVDNEITSVHFFNREDEDSETPPGPDNSSSSSVKPPEEAVIFKCFSDLVGNSDEESSPPRQSSQEDYDQVGVVGDCRRLFIRPTGSPSSGGSSTTASSAVSVDNDEDNFPGPVSASFIRPGRLSDSAASCDNPDLTMDSTAFSLHYRSIARSDSGDLKTPTRFGVSFVDKTPSQTSSPAKDGSFMVLSEGKKHSPCLLMSADGTTGGRDSNDMSIVGHNPDKYEYDRLSPSLDALLTEGSMGLTTVPITDIRSLNLSNFSKVPAVKPTGISSSKSNDGMELERGVVRSPNTFVKAAPMVSSDFNQESYSALGTSIDQVTNISLPDDGGSDVVDASIDLSFQIQDQLNKVNDLLGNQAFEPLQSQFDVQAGQKKENAVIYQNTVNAKNQTVYKCLSEAKVKENYQQDHSSFRDVDRRTDQPCMSPICNSMNSSSSWRKQLSGRSPDPLRYSTPLLKQEDSLLLNEDGRKVAFWSSTRKSKSNFKVIESSPCMSSLKEGIDSLKCRLSKYSNQTSPNKQYYEGRHVKPHVLFVEQLSSTKLKNGRVYQSLTNKIDDGFSIIQNEFCSSHNGVSLDQGKDGEFLSEMSARHTNPPAAASSPSQCTLAQRELMHLAILESRCDNRKVNGARVALNKSVPSPEKCSVLNSNALMECQISSGDQDQQKQNESLIGEGYEGLVKARLNVPSERKEWSSIPSQLMKVKETAPVNERPSMRAMTQSPARREPELAMTTSLTNEKQFIGSAVQDQLNESKSDNSKPLIDDNQEPRVSQNLFHQQDIPVPSVLKRKGREPLCDENHICKILRTERIAEVPENGACGSENFEHSKGTEKPKEQSMWKDLNKILMKFMEEMKQLDSSLYEKLDTRAICKLEDSLVHMQKAKKCEVLCSELRFQKVADSETILRHQRVVEARLLQYDVAYERAKLELMNVKHEKLLRKVKLLSSGIEDSQQLKFNYRSLSSVSGECTTNSKDHLQSGFLNPQLIKQVSCDKVIAMKRDIEALDGKTECLIRFFYTYCKMQGEPNCSNTLMLVHDYMKKKLRCKFIHDNLQLWEVEKLENRDGCYNFLLNYQGFMSQRFLINAEQSRSLRIANELNMENIMKSFPNVDADTAFAFVLDTEAPKTGVGLPCLTRETQKTNLLLHNLLEVLEEVQVAQIEIRNLIRAKFSSLSADTLNLDLFFIDFHSGWKLKATLDFSCLKCGIYPSEIFPRAIEVPTLENQKSLRTLHDKIKTSKLMQVKSSTILKLCQHISLAVQTLHR